MQYYQIKCDKAFIDDILSHFRTGDMIVFKAYNNFNSVFHGGYFGHMGIVYVKDSIPYLFEANGIEHMPLKPHHNSNGIFCTPLADRLKKYKGRCFWKRLNKEVSAEGFSEFIDYCIDTMYYDTSVIMSGVSKGLGISRCSYGTNCGEIVFLSLIKLGLLKEDRYDVPTFHYLRWLSNIEELDNGYRYLPMIEIIDHPFAE
jgi:hypothetical protein